MEKRLNAIVVSMLVFAALIVMTATAQATESLYVHAPSTTIVNQMLEVKVTCPETGPPVDNATVFFSIGGSQFQDTTDADGIAIFTPQTTGLLNITAWKTGYLQSDMIAVQVLPTDIGAIVFDTGSPANPYPSISGTHNGTITPNQTITVSSLHTYSCAGTGGHTRYARIWNSTLNVIATWNGYEDDWHNITFDVPFTLFAETEYYFEIRTGSYPQIHHTDALLTANGWINCTQFVDANGRVYYGGIPAIKLF